MISSLSALILVSLNLTFQLALRKHRIPEIYNNALAHRFGDWCQLCVSFWLGITISLIFLYLGEIDYLEFIFIIFASPGIVVLLINKTLD